uniref:Medium-chain acyl-CoA ligase ACSF2, mitochondrial n=1 Tax=Neogobius melanostomus TaxID=47308 RepID=A0A8C6U5V6_9GOBI
MLRVIFKTHNKWKYCSTSSLSLRRYILYVSFWNALCHIKKCFVNGRGLHVDSPPQQPTLSSSYVHGTSSASLLSLTVSQALDSVTQRWPDREAVVCVEDGIRKTFEQFHQDVDKFAAGLLALGLKPGDRVGVWGPNSYEWILSQFATAKAGMILVSLNPAYQMKEVEFTLKKVQCRAVICPSSFKTQRFCEILRKLCPEIDTSPKGHIQSPRLPDLRMVIVMDSEEPGMLHFGDAMEAGESRHQKQLMDLQKKLSFDDPINIQFTSGTTGNPKGACLSHHNIVNNAYFVGLRLGYEWRVMCMAVPLNHCFGSVLGGMCMAVHGITLVFPSKGYDSRANLKAMQNEKCNIVYGTPTMHTDMLNQRDLHTFDLSSIEGGVMGGAQCVPEVVYGSTENSPVTFLGFPRDIDELKLNTVGCIMPHTEAKVVDPVTGVTVPLGASGELLIRGSCVMLEYWDDEAKTREAIGKDRWYRTGDIASLNSRGYCAIEGRIKDLIIRGGENIYPAEIEQFLFTHPKVKEVQVVGVRDERLGEQVCACITLRDGESCTPDEIKKFCKGQISYFKIPHYIMFVDKKSHNSKYCSLSLYLNNFDKLVIEFNNGMNIHV